MYTPVEGDHQILKNGNILIAEGNGGRVLEVDRDGRVVWEFINRYSEEEVLRVSDAIRYPREYFVQGSWACDSENAQ